MYVHEHSLTWPVREQWHLLYDLDIDAAHIWSSLNYHHAPLLFLIPRSCIDDPIRSAFLWAVMDGVTGFALGRIAMALSRHATHAYSAWFPLGVMAWYVSFSANRSFLFNPYAISACVAKTMSSLRTCLTVLSVLKAVEASPRWMAFVHTLNCLLFTTPLLLTPALWLLGCDTYAAFGAWRSTFGLRQSDAWVRTR